MTQTTENSKCLTVVGLGLMGTAIASRFLANGWRVFVWNRTPEKSLPLIQRGAIWAERPFACSTITLISLFNSSAVWDVFLQSQSYQWMTQRVIDTTTGSPDEVEPLAAFCSKRGVSYMDSPISGSSQQTLDGQASVIVGGCGADFDACREVWACLARCVFHTGDIGSASKLKLVSNLILGLNRLALAEGLAYAECLGLPMQKTLDILKGTAAYSKVMDVKGTKMLEHDYSVQARLSQHLKDVQLILTSATNHGQTLPTTALHAELLKKGMSMGLGNLDNSAIIEVLREAML
jgi:3-hydroxyisobutyrate dehydrogenase-like beta-hydroxyacid dehydrogenase